MIYGSCMKSYLNVLVRFYISGALQSHILIKCPYSNQEMWSLKGVDDQITMNYFELKMGICLV